MHLSTTALVAALQLFGAMASPMPAAELELSTDAPVNTTELELHAIEKRGSNFLATCKDYYLKTPYFSSIVAATCKDKGGNWKTTDLGLYKCLANVGGSLEIRQDGRYDMSCDVSKGSIHSNARYCVPCKQWGGEWVNACMQMNLFIGNDDGNIECWGLRGP